jgi:peptidoglycan/xylan/chitin deacetylase (PgdA/CDA1 family)
VASAIAHGSRRVPAVALTFDDGPGAVTPALLDVLRRHGARATFDVLGHRIAGREHLLQRAVHEGHEIGVHGWRHADHRDDPAARRLGGARHNGTDARRGPSRLDRPPARRPSELAPTAEAIDALLPRLRERGWAAVTVSDLLDAAR